MKKLVIFMIIVLLLNNSLMADMVESDYQAVFAEWIDGATEFVLDDRSRVDILTEVYAIEVDYAYKWAEGVGQSLFYALKTNRVPGIVLILAKRKSYDNYINRVLLVAYEYDIVVWTIDENLNIEMIYGR